MDGEANPRRRSEPVVESRESREPYYGEEQPDAGRDERRKKKAQAVYLIEREAIQLRRVRWQSSSSPLPAGLTTAGLIETARSERPAPRVDDPIANRLVTYARPHKKSSDESMLARLRRWVASFFGRKPDSEP